MQAQIGRVVRWFDRQPGTRRTAFGFVHIPGLDTDVYVPASAVRGRRPVRPGALVRLNVDQHLANGSYFATAAEVLHAEDPA